MFLTIIHYYLRGQIGGTFRLVMDNKSVYLMSSDFSELYIVRITMFKRSNRFEDFK